MSSTVAALELTMAGPGLKKDVTVELVVNEVDVVVDILTVVELDEVLLDVELVVVEDNEVVVDVDW